MPHILATQQTDSGRPLLDPMSYILAALKKSEQERRRGQVPNLMTPPVTVMRASGRRKSGWHKHPAAYSLLTIFLLGGAAAVFYNTEFHARAYATLQSFLPPSQFSSGQPPVAALSDDAASQPSERPLNSQNRAVPPKALVIDRDPSMAGRAPVVKPLDDYAPVSPENSPGMPGRQSGDRQSALSAHQRLPAPELAPPLRPEGRAASKPLKEQPAAVSPSRLPPPTIYIPDITQLPSALRSQLPVLKLNGHIYSSKPSARMVIINGVSRRENQLVQDDLLVKEIVSGGVVMDYRGQLFQLNLN